MKPMPLNGWPMKRLLNCVRIWRPPSTAVSTDLPVSTIGGAEGSIHIVCFVSQVPAKCSASCACCGPGVAAFCQAAIIACCSASGVADACGAGCRAGSSCAAAAAANDSSAQASARSEEHTSELQSLMRISYDVICLQK